MSKARTTNDYYATVSLYRYHQDNPSKTGEGTAVIHADLRDAGTILDYPDTRRLIDFSQPLAILFVAVLHFVGDPDATQVGHVGGQEGQHAGRGAG